MRDVGYNLTLEQFVMHENVCMTGNLCEDDYWLALCTYAGSDEFIAELDNKTQFLYALFILEAEGR